MHTPTPSRRGRTDTGSEYTARKLRRRGWGCELKRSYFDTSVRNLRGLDAELDTPTLFDEEIA
jgi:hypothetical protein